MQDHISILICGACRLVGAAAESLCAVVPPTEASFRFRPDGKGGVLATPYPMIAKLSPPEISARILPDPLFECVEPNGEWLAMTPSEAWRNAVRHADCMPLSSLSIHTPAIPAFPACIDPLVWALNSAAGITDADTSARLDRANPARRVLLALQQSSSNWGQNRLDERLVYEAALVHHLIGDLKRMAIQVQTLVDLYLSSPGEDEMISALLKAYMSSYVSPKS